MNPFMRQGISVARIRRFATDHLQRLIAYNPGGIFNERIAVLTVILDNLSEAFVEDVGHFGIRKSKKIVKAKFRKSLLGDVERVYGSIVAYYGGNAATMKEFFPLGRTVFSATPDDEVIIHLDNLVDRIVDHQADLGLELVEEITVLRDAWAEVYEASEESTGQKVATAVDKRQALNALKKELFYNLNLIAQTYPNQSHKLELYMQQHLLGNPRGVIQDLSGSTAGSVGSVGTGSIGSTSSLGGSGSGSSMPSTSSIGSVSGSSSGTSVSVGSSSMGSSSVSTAPSSSSGS